MQYGLFIYISYIIKSASDFLTFALTLSFSRTVSISIPISSASYQLYILILALNA